MQVTRRVRGILTVGLFLTIVSTATGKYSGGTGEPNDPYQIATAADLITLGEDPNDYDKHFILTADIDLDPNLPGRKIFDKAVIAPAYCNQIRGTQGSAFAGVFDGRDHKLSHLTILGGDYLGLFGRMGSTARVSNLRVEAVDVSGTGVCIGGLVGSNAGSINASSSSGLVRGIAADWIWAGNEAEEAVGGLVGENRGSITSSDSTALVSGNHYYFYIGGLVGHSRGEITLSYSSGSVNGSATAESWADQSVGGLVGENQATIASSYSTASVSGNHNCYSVAGLVTGGSRVGGLIGNNPEGSVSHCYSTGPVGGYCVGGLVGYNGGSIVSSYSVGAVAGDEVGGLISAGAGAMSSVWDTEASGLLGSAGGVGLTTAEMMDPNMLGLNGFANDPNWVLDTGRDYPRLTWEKTPGRIIPELVIDWPEGGGTAEDPHRIDTAEQLVFLGRAGALCDRYFVLGADLDLDPNTRGGKLFPQAVIPSFTGVFDGNGHKIWHMTVVGRGNLGLFGYLSSGAQVRNIIIADINVSGSGYGVGGLVGCNDGDVEATYSSGSVGGTSCVGGLVGLNRHSGRIASSCSTTSVSGTEVVGGLAGQNGGGIITGCQNGGLVSGGSFVGGLVGQNGGMISKSRSSGTVTCGNPSLRVGGLIGENTGEVVECCSTGTVSGDHEVGGFIGYNLGCCGIVANSYSSGAVHGVESVGGFAGGNSYDIVNCYSSGPVSGLTDVGGFLGQDWSSSKHHGVIDCFYDTEKSGLANMCSQGGLPSFVGGSSVGGSSGCDDSHGKTTAEMQTAQTFLDAGWDFVGEMGNGTEDIWKIAERLDYPRLWWEPYDGRVTVVLGQTFTVTLESNPSTGYRWEWVDQQDSIVEQMGEAQFKPRETGDPPLVGAGGWESFDFKAVNQGQMTLKLVYRRPWEEGVEPLKTFSLQVTVP